MFSTIHNARINPNFPWYIQVSGSTQDGNGSILDIDFNFGLAILLLAILVNLYFANRLFKSGSAH